MTAEQQSEISELTQYIRVLTELKEITLSKTWIAEGQNKRKVDRIETLGRTIMVPYCISSYRDDPDSALKEHYKHLATMAEATKAFADTEIARAKIKIKAIVDGL